MSKPRIFLDTSALIASVLSSTGGARALLQLGELEVVELWVGRRVLEEADRYFQRKSPVNRPLFAQLLDAARIQVLTQPSDSALATAGRLVPYTPDAYVLAEALTANAEYLVSHDKEHLVGKPELDALPCRVLTPGECLSAVRQGL